MAKPKYTSSDTASTIVVMSGLAMTAGVEADLLRDHRQDAANQLGRDNRDHQRAADGRRHRIVRRSSRRSLTKLQAASVMLQRAAIRSSFQITLKRSRKWISSSDRPRIMVTEVCEPEFPPVSISIGI